MSSLFIVTVPAGSEKSVPSEAKEIFTLAWSVVYPGEKDCRPETAVILGYAGCFWSD